MSNTVGLAPAVTALQTPTQPVRSELATSATPSGSGALPDAPTAFDIALQVQDVQVENVKRALDAQSIVLDLLA